MKILLLLSLYLSLFSLFSVKAECIHEKVLSGYQVSKMIDSYDIWVMIKRNQYVEIKNSKQLNQLNQGQGYYTQFRKKALKVFTNKMSYDQTNLPYYTVNRIKQYLKNSHKVFERNGYKLDMIGKSLLGEPLFYVGPKVFSSEKKTIVMFGRHHGDEGTANWIIEGFVNYFFTQPEMLKKYNLLLYPMLNPDGANQNIRYNSRGKDLNRGWAEKAIDSDDEISIIYSHLEKEFKKTSKPVVVMDMHGSFTEDFIFRVKPSYKGKAFYQIQQNFISILAKNDPWQAGSFRLSNGSPGMSRIRLINKFGLNAMTHETPRDIKIKNNSGRSLKSLAEQGVAIAKSILKLY